MKKFTIVRRIPPYKITVTGKVIEYGGYEFGFPKLDEYMEITLLKSGIGFNGNGKCNLSSIKAAEKRIGEKFWPIIEASLSIEENVKNLKNIYIYNSKFHDNVRTLSRLVGFTVYADSFSMLLPKRRIDIFRFEDSLCRVGYDKKGNGSLNDFIRDTYGKEVLNLVKKLI